MSRARPSGDVMLCIDPFTHHFEGDRLFEPEVDRFNGEDILAPYLHLRDWFEARGIPVHTADRLERREVGARVNIVVSFGLQRRYKALAKRADVILSAFFAFESPVVDPSMYRGLPEAARHFKRMYSFSDSESLEPVIGARVPFEQFCLPYPFDDVCEDLWRRGNRRFLVMINHNKVPALRWKELYTERPAAVEFFARYGEIDLFGKGWDEVPYQMGRTWKPASVQRIERFFRNRWEQIHPTPVLEAARKVYKGPVPSKIETLAQYTYCLVYDNVELEGWITEKIFDCFVAGTIPIYWGAPDVERWIPADCFIDKRQFADYADLRQYLHGLTARQIDAFREAGRAFFRSQRFAPFSKRTFTERLGRIVEEDAGVPLFASVS